MPKCSKLKGLNAKLFPKLVNVIHHQLPNLRKRVEVGVDVDRLAL